jgi:hypothetical protein
VVNNLLVKRSKVKRNGSHQTTQEEKTQEEEEEKTTCRIKGGKKVGRRAGA